MLLSVLLLTTETVGEPGGSAVEGGEGQRGRVGGGGGRGGQGGPVEQEPGVSHTSLPAGLHGHLQVRLAVRVSQGDLPLVEVDLVVRLHHHGPPPPLGAGHGGCRGADVADCAGGQGRGGRRGGNVEELRFPPGPAQVFISECKIMELTD